MSCWSLNPLSLIFKVLQVPCSNSQVGIDNNNKAIDYSYVYVVILTIFPIDSNHIPNVGFSRLYKYGTHGSKPHCADCDNFDLYPIKMLLPHV